MHYQTWSLFMLCNKIQSTFSFQLYSVVWQKTYNITLESGIDIGQGINVGPLQIEQFCDKYSWFFRLPSREKSFSHRENFYIFFATCAAAMCKFKLSFDLKKGTKCFISESHIEQFHFFFFSSGIGLSNDFLFLCAFKTWIFKWLFKLVLVSKVILQV